MIYNQTVTAFAILAMFFPKSNSSLFSVLFSQTFRLNLICHFLSGRISCLNMICHRNPAGSLNASSGELSQSAVRSGHRVSLIFFIQPLVCWLSDTILRIPGTGQPVLWLPDKRGQFAPKSAQLPEQFHSSGDHGLGLVVILTSFVLGVRLEVTLPFFGEQ